MFISLRLTATTKYLIQYDDSMAPFTSVCTNDINSTYSALVSERVYPIVRPIDDDYLSTSPKGIKQRERRWVKREIRRKEANEGGTITSDSREPRAWRDEDFPELDRRR